MFVTPSVVLCMECLWYSKIDMLEVISLELVRILSPLYLEVLNVTTSSSLLLSVVC